MKEIKSNDLLLLILAIVMIIFPSFINDFLTTVIGGILILFSFLKFYKYYKHERNINVKTSLFFGITTLVIGIFILLNKSVIISVLPVISGIIVLLIGIDKLNRAFLMRSNYGNKYISVLSASIILIALGIIFITKPVFAADIIVRIVGIIILMNCFYDFFSIKPVRVKKNKKVIKTIK